MEVNIKDIHVKGSKQSKQSKKSKQSKTLKISNTENILEAMDNIIDVAEDIRDRKDIENPELLRSLRVVESFLRKNKRICYGGMAINAQLPKEKQFYDFTRELPDYDFYTPTPNRDVRELIRMLRKEGFKDISIRLATNPGTTKINVDFSPVADITYMPEWIFKELTSRAFVKDGLYYTDSDFLRLKMYLELSRPLGEVDRWKKVYQRLNLLSNNQPIDMTTCKPLENQMTIPNNVHDALLEYVMKQKRIFIGAEVEEIYKNPTVFRKEAIDSSVHPVVILSQEPKQDAENVKKILQEFFPLKDLHILTLKQKGDFLPNISGVVHGKTIVFLSIETHICHSYNAVQYKSGSLHIGSLDTCIYIFYLLSYLHDLEGVLPYTFECLAKRLVNISHETRDKGKTGIFPLVSITCSGHQSGIRSLLRHKLERVKAYKLAQKKRHLRRTMKNKNKKDKEIKD